MPDRPAILEAKVEKLAEIIRDGNDLKDSGGRTVSESRQAQRDAAAEVMKPASSVSEVENISPPSER